MRPATDTTTPLQSESPVEVQQPPATTIAERSEMLLAAAGALCDRSKLARQESAAARRQAQAIRARMTEDSQVRLSGSSEGVDARGVRSDRRRLIRRTHERLARLGRRQSDRRRAVAEHRRLLLVGPHETWRLIAAPAFEEVGYVVYAADDAGQAFAFSARLLPDAIVVQMASAEAVALLGRLSDAPGTANIPVVVLVESLASSEARDALAAGAIALLPNTGDVDTLVAEVDTLIAAAPRAQRALKRRLLDLQALAHGCQPSADAQAMLRFLIDRLQVAIFAVDQQGHCIAASHGATALTGYSRAELLHTSVFQPGFAGGRVSDARWQLFLINRHFTGTTTITTRAGKDITVHAAAVAEILPGVHLAALAVA